MNGEGNNDRAGAASAKTGDEAAAWVVRRDRGLTPQEQVEFDSWLGADPRNEQALARSSRVWGLLDLEPAAVPARNISPIWGPLAGLAAAAALVVGVIQWQKPAPAPVESAPVQAAAGPRNLTLTDGTFVTLNADSEVVERFTTAERRVLLLRGQAHFAVTKNPARPFIVTAGPVEVRAVGTAFEVNVRQKSIEVLVTEGTVRVGPEVLSEEEPQSVAALPYVVAGQKAVVDLVAAHPGHVQVVAVSAEEQEKILSWMTPYIRLKGATLAELAAEFHRRTGHQLVMEDKALLDLRIGGRFRADDLDGFVRVLVEHYGLEAELRDEKTTVLRRRR